MLLEFEKPIAILEKKLSAMQDLHKKNDSEKITAIIQKLEKEIAQLQKETFAHLTRWQRIQLARHTDRPYTLDFITHITDSFIALYGDRCAGDDKAIVGGFGSINGQTVMLIGHQKGRNTKERKKRNFGMANPEGYKKALRLMRLAEKFNKPIVTFIDTPGAYPGLEAEERGQALAIAENLKAMFALQVPIIAIVIGEGASGGALGIGIGDRVFMLENTWYSVISPESCSSILWHSWRHKEQAAEALKLTATDMLSYGLIDDIIQEPLGGAHRDVVGIAMKVKKIILKEIQILNQLSSEKRLAQRVEKFTKMGKYNA